MAHELTVSFDELCDAFRAVAAGGDITHEEAVALARLSPAAANFAFRHVLDEVTSDGNPITNPACKVMQIMWDVHGPTQSLREILVDIPQPYFGIFLDDQIRSDPYQFSEEDLVLIRCRTDSPTTHGLIGRARVLKVKQKALRLLNNPRDLTEDVRRLQARVRFYNFTAELNELLDKVEEEMGRGDGFDHAAMMKHLRSFFEKLHEDAARLLQEKKPELKNNTDLTKCQQVIDYLQQKDVFTGKTQALGRSLYGVLSEEGVHALESTAEYVRLCRNMVAEYGLILFYELDRRLCEREEP